VTRGAHCIAALVAAALVAGCGTSDQDKIAAVLRDYNAALVDGDGKKACALFDDAGRRRLVSSLKQLAPRSSATACEGLVKDVSSTISANDGKRIKGIKIRDVRVKGARATAQSGVRTTLVKQGGSWKIVDFAGSADTPSQGGAVPKGCTRQAAPKPRQSGKLSAPSGSLSTASPPTVRVETNCGTFAFRMDTTASPRATASVAALARAGFYDDTVFHRIVPGFVIQGGDPTSSGSGGAGYTTVDTPASTTRYTFGTVAMAKGGAEPPGTASSQFFVVTAPTVGLPPDYAVIGHVTSGGAVVRRIGALGDQQERPTFVVVVKRMTVSS
jgi:cyclophilin family peptidyl-prolyl cis-trans isomerase